MRFHTKVLEQPRLLLAVQLFLVHSVYLKPMEYLRQLLLKTVPSHWTQALPRHHHHPFHLEVHVPCLEGID
jgi:hypothetical protein